MSSNTKTLLIESNNSSSKLYTTRQQRKSVVGTGNIKKSNSQWRTDLKYGVQVEEGDTITISGTQINLRGEPDSSMEFSGAKNSEFDDDNALVDNISTVEYGYYFTNNKQYNFNLPMARHFVTKGERFWKPDYGYWKGEQPEDTFTDSLGDAWDAFRRSYPAWAIEGCYKATESQPPKDVSTIPGAKSVNSVERWQVVDSELANLTPSEPLPPSIGYQACGLDSETAISNGPFSIAHPNEKRLYLLKRNIEYAFTRGIPSSNHEQAWNTNILQDVETDRIPIQTKEGFQTPSSVAQDITEQLHERSGEASAWTTEHTESNIYLHDAKYFLAMDDNAAATASDKIPSGGYRWDTDNTLTRVNVSQVTDKMMKCVRTSTGDLLDQIVELNVPNHQDYPEANWPSFVADIPGNIGWRGQVDPGNQQGQGAWNRPVDANGVRGDSTYLPEKGRALFYNNLLCGEIGRYNSYQCFERMKSGNSHEIGDLIDLFINSGTYPSPEDLLQGAKLDRATFPAPIGRNNLYNTDVVYISGGRLITYAMAPSGWDPQNPPADSRGGASEFGVDKIVTTDHWGSALPYLDIPNQGSYPPLGTKKTIPQSVRAVSNRITHGGGTIGFEDRTNPVVAKRKNMVWPTNIMATPRAIAEVKKALWANRRARKDINSSIDTGSVRNDCKNPNIYNTFRSSLDYYFTDDGASVGTNSAKGVADSGGLTMKSALPCPYAIALCEGYGAPPGFDVATMFNNTNYNSRRLTVNAPSENFVRPNPNIQGSTSVPKTLQPSARNGSRDNRIDFQTVWSDEFKKFKDWEDSPNLEGIFLNPSSIFKFTDNNGRPFAHTEFFEPQDPENPLFLDENGNRYDLWDDQDPEQDAGVALCAVYYKPYEQDGIRGMNQLYPDVLYPAGLDPNYPGTPLPFGGNNAEREEFYNTPFLAFIMAEPEFDTDNPISQHFLPPMIGELFGQSPSFMDGEYAKVVNTQRANPRAYQSILETLKATDTDYDSYYSRYNPLYYNLYDYVPYVMIGSEDPNCQFGASSGRFEIADLHTPLYVGNGSWMGVADQLDTASNQANEKIAALNTKNAWTTMLTYETKLKGAQIDNNSLLGVGRYNPGGNNPGAGDGWIYAPNDKPNQGLLVDYNSDFKGLTVVPWGEIYQDGEKHKVITSQSGVGIFNIFVPFAKQDLNEYILSNYDDDTKHQRMSAWMPNLFEDTLFNKMGFEIEQLLPMTGFCQSNGFNRSNYNKFIGYEGQNLSDKTNNMVYPFTTNGYISGTINIQGQNRNWVGYDTVYGMTCGTSCGWGNFANKVLTMDDYGDTTATLRKILPPGEVYEMYSMGALNFMTGTQITTESDLLVARKQPKKFDYSYLVIYSDIVEQRSNFFGSNKILPLPAVGYLNRNYSSSDFFYSFTSDFNYIADRSHVINNFNVEVRLPNGKLANLEDNSSVIFKVTKAVPPILPIPEPPKPPTKKEMTEEEKEEEAYYKSLIG